MSGTLPLWMRVIALATGLTLWLGQYFLINNATRSRRPRFRPATALDGRLPVIPSLIFVYFSTYLLGALPALIVGDVALYVRFAVSYGIITALSAAVQLAYPSEIVRLETEGRPGLSWRLIGWFQGVCKPYGNFPSVHVAFAVLAVIAGFVVAGPVVGSLFLVWAALVAASTLALRQHYILDALAGAALGGAVTALVLVV